MRQDELDDKDKSADTYPYEFVQFIDVVTVMVYG